MKHSTPSVTVLIALNALIFAATYYVPGQEPVMMDLLALHFPQSDSFRIWQFVSHMFMHGSPMHILLNMFGLFTFGRPLEMMWGTRRFLTFYFIAGIGAGLIYTGINVYEFDSIYRALAANGYTTQELQRFLNTQLLDPSRLGQISEANVVELRQLYLSTVVGASGAIYGVLVAFALLFPNAKLFLLFFPVPIAAKFVVPGLLLLDLFSGVTGISIFGGGIAHFAHIGGAVIGFALMMYWRKSLPKHIEPTG